MRSKTCENETSHILVPVALFASLDWRNLRKRNEGNFISFSKAPPVKRRGKGHGDENESLNSSIRHILLEVNKNDQKYSRDA